MLVAMTRIRAGVLGLTLLLGACVITTSDCADDLQIRTSPIDTTIRIGQQFHVGVTLRGCHGQLPLSDVITWTSEDSTVARVDSTSGTVTGWSVGATVIWGTGVTYGSVAASRVTVLP
jgi:Bacterial Ig-like domain (group 2)